MSIQVIGTVERRGIGLGTWALVDEMGETYELRNASMELCHSRQRVRVQGNVRNDVMTWAAIGPILEVKSFRIGV